MDNKLVQRIIEDYLRENLKIKINREGSGKDYCLIGVEILLDDETITSDEVTVNFNDGDW
jgi:hypothetical protein